MTLKARNLRAMRHNSILQSLFGIGGRRVPLAQSPAPGSDKIASLTKPGLSPKAWLKRFISNQRGQQDKCIGLAELAEAIHKDRAHFPPSDFSLHLTELTLAIQGAGPDGATTRLQTKFDPLPLPERTKRAGPDYKQFRKPSSLVRLLKKLRSK